MRSVLKQLGQWFRRRGRRPVSRAGRPVLSAVWPVFPAMCLTLLAVCLAAGGCGRVPQGTAFGGGAEKGLAADTESGAARETAAGGGAGKGLAADAGCSAARETAAGAGSGAANHGNEAASASESRLRVAATIFPYYDFVRQIAGDLVELKLVVPAGMDSHSFEPTPADMRAIQEADVLSANGGAMEQWVSRVLEAVDAPNLTVVTMMDYANVYQEEIVEGMEDEEHDHGQSDVSPGAGFADDEFARTAGSERAEISGNAGVQMQEPDSDSPDSFDHDGHEEEIEYDEHIWTSPVNAMEFVRVIADALSEADPANADAYAANAARYLEELQSIHEGFLAVSEARRRNMIVVGDKFPFRYLAEEYGLTYRAAFSGCSTDTEPSARTIAYLIDKVREGQIPAVYYLELSSHRVAEIIAEETGAQPLLLHSCHNVTRTELDAGVTYADLMRGNIESLRKGLDE